MSTVPQDLVNAHVRRFNNGVREGDWQTYGEGFAPDAMVTFDCVPIPPMVGREAIIKGYQTAPPDDTITVLAVNGNSVEFAWDAEPRKTAGSMTMTVADGLITSLIVRLGNEDRG
ncbi:nuclear transport factor 2 family protein [Lentzea alba]|uniref:nuclear transport factor 2 family protein n=1 Tax=Lentzea alba TaxID=2714351 RepID=UPI0039BFDE61